MEYEKLHQNSKKSWFIARGIWLLIIGGALINGRIFASKYIYETSYHTFKVVIDIVIVIILIFLLLNTFIYPIIEYKQWKYLINKDKIEFSEGIFLIKKTTIPIVRIQHIQVNQGIINRWLKLADISISTAGGQHKIPNIDIEKAERISDYLNNKVKEKVEENV